MQSADNNYMRTMLNMLTMMIHRRYQHNCKSIVRMMTLTIVYEAF